MIIPRTSEVQKKEMLDLLARKINADREKVDFLFGAPPIDETGLAIPDYRAGLGQ